MKLLGLIGHPLTHSFSANYFREKFLKLNISGFEYELFDLPELKEVRNLSISQPNLIGLNVTVPYKEGVIEFLDELDENAQEIGAVNTIDIRGEKWKGYNTDYLGFKKSLTSLVAGKTKPRALVLGSGGSSKAVQKGLTELGIEFHIVSRKGRQGLITYEELEDGHMVGQCHLIINTTPLGMFPNVETHPEIDYSQITPDHLLFDLVYNPEKTAFLESGEKRGAQTKNGLEMLYIQADRAWEIWTGK